MLIRLVTSYLVTGPVLWDGEAHCCCLEGGVSESSTEGALTLGTRLGSLGNSLLVRLFNVAVAIGLFRGWSVLLQVK